MIFAVGATRCTRPATIVPWPKAGGSKDGSSRRAVPSSRIATVDPFSETSDTAIEDRNGRPIEDRNQRSVEIGPLRSVAFDILDEVIARDE